MYKNELPITFYSQF